MTVEAELADGRILEFPDGTDPTVVQATVKKMLAPTQPVNSIPGVKESLLSLIAPGGLARITGQAEKDYSKAAYDVGGAVSEQSTKMGIPPVPSAALGTAANVGMQTIPMLGGGEAAKAATPAFEAASKSLMMSALKPTLKAHQLGQADRAVETALNEGISVSRGGVEKLQGKIDEIENSIQTALQGSRATVDKGAVASRIQDLISKIDRTNPTPQNARAAAESVYNDFVSNVLVPNRIPVDRANELKRTIYREVKDQYGQLASDAIEAKKALGRGFKEEIASAVPQMDQLAKQGELINALNIVERRAMMQLNNNPGGLALLARRPEAMVAFLADKSSLFKSLIARMLNAGSDVVPETVGRIVGGTIGSYSGQPPREQ